MKKIRILLFLLNAGLIVSCDYVTVPYPKKHTSVTPPNAIVKKVLIEEYTASQCSNCPHAAAAADLLMNANKGRVFVICVHCSSLAAPSGTTFPYDFRTPAGNNYNNLYVNGDATGLPTGMIDRINWFPGTVYPKSDQAYQTDWTSDVNTRLASPDSVFLQITNNYTPSTRVLNCIIKTKFLTPLTSTYNLVALMTEDSISSPQNDIDSNHVLLNYMHRFVLRGAIDGQVNGTGIPIALPTAPVTGDSITTSLPAFTLPSSFPNSGGTCNDKHCYVVAFFYDMLTGDILQVEQQKLY